MSSPNVLNAQVSASPKFLKLSSHLLLALFSSKENKHPPTAGWGRSWILCWVWVSACLCLIISLLFTLLKPPFSLGQLRFHIILGTFLPILCASCALSPESCHLATFPWNPQNHLCSSPGWVLLEDRDWALFPLYPWGLAKWLGI